MDKELEFTKKIVLLRKLVREGLITEQEYNKARQKLASGKTEKAKDQVSSQKHKRRKRPDMIKPIPTGGMNAIIFCVGFSDSRSYFVFAVGWE